jgi:urea transport system substrate-binding protein
MLWYPLQYEGQECSNSIFYSGATPNQQIEPAVQWLLKKFPNLPFFLVGSDYVFPRTANDIIKSMLVTLGRDMVGEAYVPLPANSNQSDENAVKLRKVADDIKAKHPNGVIIFNTLNGDANVRTSSLSL